MNIIEGAITLPFYFGDLMSYALTDCQSGGLLRISLTNKHIVICGAAGTGKTFLLRKLLDTLGENKRIVYCAPTHQAKQVLAESVSTDCHTIHAVLKIHPETYEDEVKFDQSGVPDLSEVDVLVIDEASMLDGHIFSILMNTIPASCRIIGLGDPYQCQPVKNEPGIISPIFFDPRFERVILNEIVRQSKGNPIIEVATAIRKTGCDIFACNDGKDQGVFKHTTLGSFMAKYFEYVKTPEDMLRYRILSYTNDSVNKFNGLVRQRVYNTIEPVVTGEYLILQQPLYRELKYQGMEIKELVFHNGQTVQVELIKGNTSLKESIELPGLPHLDPITINYYQLVIQCLERKDRMPIDVIFDESSIGEIECYLHYAAINYKRMARTGTSRSKMRTYWEAFWELKNRFINIKGAAASTFHKAQGSTFDGVFIHNALGYVDEKIARQLKYVGTTRARYFVHFI